ncbi:hypothetical protein [Saccharopolyspora tripterygii]
MGKSSMPMMKTGGGAGKKLLGAAVTLALLVMVVQHPTEAAQWAKNGAAFVGHLADALGLFFGEVLG